MDCYCIEDFKVEFEKIKSKNSYRILEQEIIKYFFGKTSEELRTGVRLNNSVDAPYIKKRIGGRGGFRVYFLFIIKKESVYLLFVHPKTGSMGSDNITDESKAYLYKKVLDCIVSKDLYKLTVDNTGKRIIFQKSEDPHS